MPEKSKDIYYALISDVNRKGGYNLENGVYKEPPVDLYVDVLINDEIKRYKVNVLEGGYYSVGESVLFNIQNNTFTRYQNMPKEVWEAFKKIYIRKYEQIASGSVMAKEPEFKSRAKPKHYKALNINDLFLGISFRTGKVLLLLKFGDPYPDQWFGNNQNFIDLIGEEGYISINDAGIDMPNCGRLFGVRPFTNFINGTGKLRSHKAIVLFSRIIPEYLKDPEIIEKIFKFVEESKIGIGKFYSTIEEKGLDRYDLGKLKAIFNLEAIIEMYTLKMPAETSEEIEENKL